MAKVTKVPSQHCQTWLRSPKGLQAWLTMLCRPFGDLTHVWLFYVGPLVILAVFGCYVGPLVTLAVFGYLM